VRRQLLPQPQPGLPPRSDQSLQGRSCVGLVVRAGVRRGTWRHSIMFLEGRSNAPGGRVRQGNGACRRTTELLSARRSCATDGAACAGCRPTEAWIRAGQCDNRCCVRVAGGACVHVGDGAPGQVCWAARITFPGPLLNRPWGKCWLRSCHKYYLGSADENCWRDYRNAEQRGLPVRRRGSGAGARAIQSASATGSEHSQPLQSWRSQCERRGWHAGPTARTYRYL